MDVSEVFGIRLREEEVQDLIVKHLGDLGYLVRPEDIKMVPLTGSKVEFIIRSFGKK